MAKKKVVKKVVKKKGTSANQDSLQRIANLEKKLGEMGDTIGKQNEFIQGASTIINTLAYTPELKKAWDTYGKTAGQVQGQQQTQVQGKTKQAQGTGNANSDLAKQVGGVVASQREAIVAQFEQNAGINNLKKEEKDEARKKIASYLADFGLGIKNIPLPNLRSNLEKAYIGTHAEKLREEGKLEGIVQSRANAQGVMGSFKGKAGDKEDEAGKLTSGQVEWAEKLGVDPKEAQKTYQARDDEQTRLTKAEVKAKK